MVVINFNFTLFKDEVDFKIFIQIIWICITGSTILYKNSNVIGYLFTYLFIYLIIYLFIYLFIY